MIFLDAENRRSTIVFLEKRPITIMIEILLQDRVRYSLERQGI